MSKRKHVELVRGAKQALRCSSVRKLFTKAAELFNESEPRQRVGPGGIKRALTDFNRRSTLRPWLQKQLQVIVAPSGPVHA